MLGRPCGKWAVGLERGDSMGVDNDSETAYRQGYNQGTDDATNAVSTATPPQFEGDRLYRQGYAQGLADQQSAMAGFVAGVADERAGVNHAVPAEYAQSQAYADAYQMGEATAAGYDAGVADAHDHLNTAAPPMFADSPTYAEAYQAGETVGGAETQIEEDRVAAYSRETERRLAEEKARAPFEHRNDPESIYYQKPETQAELDERLREAARLRESDEQQQIMWSDGSVSTRKQHEEREIREHLEQIETLGGVGEMHNPHGVGGGEPAE